LNIKVLKYNLPIDITSNLLASGILGILIGITYFFTKNWILNNIIGICFSVIGIV
jgi:hypothetical protein